MAVNFKIEGLKELEQLIQELGKLPQACVTQSAKSGAKIALADAKAHAPMDTGMLLKGIIMGKEKKVKKGKAVYDIKMDPKYNDIFAKISKDGKRAYYPASMEYGFITKSGRKWEGNQTHFLGNSIDVNRPRITKEILDELIKKLEKAKAKVV